MKRAYILYCILLVVFSPFSFDPQIHFVSLLFSSYLQVRYVFHQTYSLFKMVIVFMGKKNRMDKKANSFITHHDVVANSMNWLIDFTRGGILLYWYKGRYMYSIMFHQMWPIYVCEKNSEFIKTQYTAISSKVSIINSLHNYSTTNIIL